MTDDARTIADRILADPHAESWLRVLAAAYEFATDEAAATGLLVREQADTIRALRSELSELKRDMTALAVREQFAETDAALPARTATTAHLNALIAAAKSRGEG